MRETHDYQQSQSDHAEGSDRSERSGSADSNNERAAEKNTFVVQVRRQQNATWQGSIHWVEDEKTQHFRSALELLRLMDEALTKKR